MMLKRVLLLFLIIFSLVSCDKAKTTTDKEDNKDLTEEKLLLSLKKKIYKKAVFSGFEYQYIDWEHLLSTMEIVVRVKDGDIEYKLIQDDEWITIVKLDDLKSKDGFKEYQTYLINHPDYNKTEEEWIVELLYGRLKILLQDEDLTHSPGDEKTEITPLRVCVDNNFLYFYQEVLDRYIGDYNLPIEIDVVGVNIDNYVDEFANYPERAGDIVLTKHTNLGKLIESNAISAINDARLVSYVFKDVSEQFLNSVYLNNGNTTALYGVPVSATTAVLYYDKDYFSNNNAVSSWEKILETAQSVNKLSTTYLGNDGFSYSHWLLAQPLNDKAVYNFGNMGSLNLFENGNLNACKSWGDDQVAIHSYAQRFTLNANGKNGCVLKRSWTTELYNHSAITLIGDLDNLNSVKHYFGNNFGISSLPTFTLTKSDEYGQATAGMEFKSGSFNTIKCFVKNNCSNYSEYLDEILYFLASTEVQLDLYQEYGVLPVSLNARYGVYEIDELYYAQMEQEELASKTITFGCDSSFLNSYYSMGANDIIVNIHENFNVEFSNKTAIRLALQKISYIWANGRIPESDDVAIAWAENYN